MDDAAELEPPFSDAWGLVVGDIGFSAKKSRSLVPTHDLLSSLFSNGLLNSGLMVSM
jgi:hypothetical protein